MPSAPDSTKITELKEHRGKLSRAIGNAKRNGEPIDALLEQMASTTALIKQLEKTAHKDSAPANTAGIEEVKLPAFLQQADPASAQPAKPVTVHRVDIADTNAEVVWQRYITQHPHSTPYHHYSVRHLIENSFRQKTHYFIAEYDNGAVAGVLPLAQLNSTLFGNYAVSLPFFNYGGALADHTDIEQQLMTYAWRECSRLGIRHIEFRDIKPRPGYAQKTGKVSMLLALPDSSEQLWNSIGSKVRAQIKKAERFNTEIKFGHLELLDDFYSVFSQNMRDLGTPVYHKRFFAKLLATPDLNARLVVCYNNSAAAGCALLTGHRDCLEIPFASTLRRYNAQNCNMLMYWKILCYAIQNRFDFFDFGRSTKEENTYKFKKQWGSKPQQLYWHYCLADDEQLPQLNPNNPKYRLAITLWQRLPVWVTQLIGPLIAKNLP